MIAFKALEKKGIQKLDIPGDGLELGLPEVRGIIFALYKEWRKNHSPLDYFPISELVKENWCWKEGTGRTLVQRISRILGTNGFRLDKSYLGDLGNSIREAIPMLKEYYVDITQDFDWQAGEFADSESCFWDGRSEVKAKMSQDSRFYALRFFSPHTQSTFWDSRSIHTGYIGTGRAWLFCDTVEVRVKRIVTNEQIIVIFNSYGHPLKQQAAILATLVGYASKRITVANRKRTTGGLFINNGGYIIGPTHVIDKIDHFDFGLRNQFDGNMGDDDDMDGDYPDEEMAERVSIMNEMMLGNHRRTNKKYKRFFNPKDRRAKKVKKRRYKRTNNSVEQMARSFNTDTIYWSLNGGSRWGKSKASGLYYWRLYQRLLAGRFYSILMRILSHKITNGGLNDNPKKKN